MSSEHDDDKSPAMDALLDEVLGGCVPPDLSARILQAAEESHANSNEPTSTPGPASRTWRRVVGRGVRVALASAAAFFAIMFIRGKLDEHTRGPTRPPDPMVAPAGIYRGPSSVVDTQPDRVELRAGWVLLVDGAPPIWIGNERVERASGKTLLWAGTPPTERDIENIVRELRAQDWGFIPLSDRELAIAKTLGLWVTSPDASLCVASGTVDLNGTTIEGDRGDARPPPTFIHNPKR